MDTKSLSKSKRSYSLHHQSRNPHRPKPPSGGTATGSNKQARERARQAGLPSNWDRYEEEEIEPGSEAAAPPPPYEVVLPKSKGADFRYLLAEAQSSQSHSISASSIDDVFSQGDFDFGLGSMLSVRGEGIVSWLGNDNFVVEEERASSHEASFLSLNLYALAEQLEKVDASERLYIEPELLPAEMLGRGSKTSIQESDKILTRSEQSTSISEKLLVSDVSKRTNLFNEHIESISSGATPASSYIATSSFNQGSDEFSQEKDIMNYHENVKSSQSRALESSTWLNTHSVADTKKESSTFKAAAAKAELDVLHDDVKSNQNRALQSSTHLDTYLIENSKKESSAFEAADAEAELDMLLNSFREANVLDSSSRMSRTLDASQKGSSIAQPLVTANPTIASQTTSNAIGLDDTLDDLLELTSNMSSQNDTCKPGAVKASSHENHFVSPSQSVSKSKVLDDFDSWLDTL